MLSNTPAPSFRSDQLVPPLSLRYKRLRAAAKKTSASADGTQPGYLYTCEVGDRAPEIAPVDAQEEAPAPSCREQTLTGIRVDRQATDNEPLVQQVQSAPAFLDSGRFLQHRSSSLRKMMS